MISRRLHIIIGGEAMTLCHELNRMVAGDPGTGRRSYAAKKGAPLFHSNYILRFTTRKAFLYTHVGEVDELSLFSSTFFLSHSSPLIFFLFFFFTCDGVSEACSLFVSFLRLDFSPAHHHFWNILIRKRPMERKKQNGSYFRNAAEDKAWSRCLLVDLHLVKNWCDCFVSQKEENAGTSLNV